MARTYREYPIMEICLSARNLESLSSGAERVMEGDITVVRRPYTHIGSVSGKRKLWLRVEGLSDDEFMLSGSLEENGTTYDKRRYCIPFARLKRRVPDFDIDKARDPDVVYQPFIPVDEDGPFWFLDGSARKPLDAHGLIFDKLTQRYL